MIARLLRRAAPFRILPTGILLVTLAVVTTTACNRMPLFAPTGSQIVLNATSQVLSSNSSIDIIAQVIEAAGTPAHNGTVVTFTTTVGNLEPPEVRTTNGKASVRLHAAGQSGVATVTAFSGEARAELEILVGGAAAGAINLTANPRTVQPGGTTQIAAQVTDFGGNALPGIPISFATDAGTLSASSVTTDSAGIARVQLTTDRDAEVTARIPGSEIDATMTISVSPPIDVIVTAAPNPVAVNAPTVFTADVTVPAGTIILRYEWDFTNNGVVDVTTTGRSVSHVYSTPGLSVARVRVVGSGGNEGVALTTVNVTPITVTITAQPATQTVNQPVLFTATVTGGTPISFEWDFGDGTSQTTTGSQASHSYGNAGTYVVTVRVIFSDGTTATGRGLVTIT